jgi:hypothetical protein
MQLSAQRVQMMMKIAHGKVNVTNMDSRQRKFYDTIRQLVPWSFLNSLGISDESEAVDNPTASSTRTRRLAFVFVAVISVSCHQSAMKEPQILWRKWFSCMIFAGLLVCLGFLYLHGQTSS